MKRLRLDSFAICAPIYYVEKAGYKTTSKCPQWIRHFISIYSIGYKALVPLFDFRRTRLHRPRE